jgi:hypothetical protein
MNRIFFLLIAFTCIANFTDAQIVAGVYRGNMEVDSPKNTINFELTLQEKKGKISGYCYRLFIKGDTVYYNLLKVAGRISDNILIVEDVRSVSNNFETSTRGIKTRFFFKLDDIKDTAVVLPGTWETGFWKNYMPLTGTITVIRERKYKETQLYSRMKDLNMLEELEMDEETIASTNKKSKVDSQTVVKNNTTPSDKEKKLEKDKKTKTKENTKPTEDIAKTKINKSDNQSAGVETNKKVITPSAVPNTIAIKERKSEPAASQNYEIYEDSITLSIYDNGEIDGDTVSVFLNDVRIVEKIGLSATAYKIKIPVERNKVNKIELFAENLGKIPPNTGLLVIYSGDKRYQIFFSATLEKNAVIYLERKE